MTKTRGRRSWSLVERISPKAGALLREAEDLENMVVDFAGIFEPDGPKANKDFFHIDASEEKKVCADCQSNQRGHER